MTWIRTTPLKHRIDPYAPEYAGHADIQDLRQLMVPGDEIWFFDEPAPPEITAGALGYEAENAGRLPP